MIIIGTGRGKRHALREDQERTLCGRHFAKAVEYPGAEANCQSCVNALRSRQRAESQSGKVFRYVYEYRKDFTGVVPMYATGHVEAFLSSSKEWLALCALTPVFNRKVVDDYPLPGRALCPICKQMREEIKSE